MKSVGRRGSRFQLNLDLLDLKQTATNNVSYRGQNKHAEHFKMKVARSYFSDGLTKQETTIKHETAI